MRSLAVPPPTRVGMGVLRVTFINHATTLLQLDSVNILTDPIYSDRASPVSFAGPHRVRPPGIRFEDLPPIDAVVLSHNHYDHMDVTTLRRLQHAFPHLKIFAGLGNKAFLEEQKLEQVSEMDWWQSTALGGTTVTITSVPNQHFSNRGLLDQDRTLWTGWVLEGTNGRAYFGGDTAYGPHFKAVGDKLGPFRLAVLPIGAYMPEWFMSPVCWGPLSALAANALSFARTSWCRFTTARFRSPTMVRPRPPRSSRRPRKIPTCGSSGSAKVARCPNEARRHR